MAKAKTASEKIDEYVSEIDDWRRDTFAEIRKVILEADPELIEEWKWMGTPTWSRDGIVAVANAHKGKVKLTFDQGRISRIPRSCSMRASKGISGAPSTSLKRTKSIRLR